MKLVSRRSTPGWRVSRPIAQSYLARTLATSRAGGAGARGEYEHLKAELDRIQDRMRTLEAAHPEIRSAHAVSDGFYPPKFHHVNIVSARGPEELLAFYRDVMRMDEMPTALFPRSDATAASGSDVPISFSTDGVVQMHLATQDLGVGFRNSMAINPIGVGPVGHIAFRTNNINAFKGHLDAHGVHYADYGTRFAKEWHQLFFLDPVGTIVEVHAVVA